MECKVCLSKTNKFFKALILKKYKVQYFYCNKCGFLFTEKPYWLNEAYNSSIGIFDTGIMQRNVDVVKKISMLLYIFFDKKSCFLDYGGGYGILTRLMRDIGFDFYWHDLYTENIFAKGFEYSDDIGEMNGITAIECFEHLIDPLKEIQKMLKISKNIIFTTSLLPDPIPAPSEWWYYALDGGQHISFYSSKTLKYLANLYNLKFYSAGGLHLMSDKDFNNVHLGRLLAIANQGVVEKIKELMNSKTYDDMLKLLN